MNQSDRIPVAVIGVGRMGRHHARIYREMPDVELLAVVDADEDRAATVADERGCGYCLSVDALLEQYPQVRAVSVAVPTVAHRAVAEQLFTAGVACLIEKPLAQSPEIGQKICEAADRAGVVAMVGHTERFNPAVRAISEMDIKPRFIECDRVSPMTFRSIDVGVVFDLMIHDLDIILMLAKAPIKEIRACGLSVLGEHEDVADARIEFEDGCVAKITTSRLAMKTERKLRIFSEAAYISLDYAGKSGMAIRRTGNIDRLHELRAQLAAGEDLSSLDYADFIDIQPLEVNDTDALTSELTNFLDVVRGRGKPAVDVHTGLRAVEVAQAVIETIRSHTWQGFESLK